MEKCLKVLGVSKTAERETHDYYAWLVWEKGKYGPTELKWIK